jgi:hypothetical protein
MGTAQLKLQKIIQAGLYKEKDERIAVSSIYERTELSPWLIEAVNHVASNVSKFLDERPEVASQIFLPHHDICQQCNHPVCPEKKEHQAD